jgi:hypothetical protein
MSWTHVRNEFRTVDGRAWRRRSDRAPWMSGSRADSPAIRSIRSWSEPFDVATSGATSSTHLRQPKASHEGTRRHASSDDKVQMMWRRRGLQRRGAHMRMAMAASVGEYSLAMLDEAGIVVSWHDCTSIGSAAGGVADDVVDEHMCQFYLLDDVVGGVPHRDLRVAVANGISIERGWRRRAWGAVYWGTTIIQAVVNRNGQLQGFSHLTRLSAGPREGSHSCGYATRQHRSDARSSVQASALVGTRQGMRS